MKGITIAVVLWLVPAVLLPQQPKPSTPRAAVEKLMSAEEFKNAGLQKLTAEELAALNAWLTKYTYALASTLVQRETSVRPTSTPEIVESYIDGDFEGWSGDTLFKLDNGQIWQQASYSYMYHYSYHPKVLIFKSGATYKMQVQGVTELLPVVRLK